MFSKGDFHRVSLLLKSQKHLKKLNKTRFSAESKKSTRMKEIHLMDYLQNIV